MRSVAEAIMVTHRMKAHWLIRSVAAGTAGTAAMTLAYATERRLRPKHRGPLDYDDSLVPGEIVAGIMHLPHVTGREENELGLALRWSYWGNADDGDVDPVSAARPHPTAVALAASRACHRLRHARRLRRRGRGRRRLAVVAAIGHQLTGTPLEAARAPAVAARGPTSPPGKSLRRR